MDDHIQGNDEETIIKVYKMNSFEWNRFSLDLIAVEHGCGGSQ
jgi:hypothetical protein